LKENDHLEMNIPDFSVRGIQDLLGGRKGRLALLLGFVEEVAPLASGKHLVQ
jgi:hypothetical protein